MKSVLGLRFFFSLLLTIPTIGKAFETGFNQGWFFNTGGGKTFLTSYYSPAEVSRILKLTKQANGNILRVWIFGDTEIPSVNWDMQRQPISLKPEVLQNLQSMLVMAKEEKVKIFLTFFDGNSLKHSNDEAAKSRFRALINNEGGRLDLFASNILEPVLKVLQANAEVVYGIDLVNEVDYLVDSGFSDGWKSAREFTKKLRDSVKAYTKIPMTISFGWWFPQRKILKQVIPAELVDFYDIHLYNDSGEISDCGRLAEFSKAYNKPIILGEFGQFPFPHNYSDERQVRITRGFLTNAKACGFGAALAWRLSDVRPGHNREARFSYEAYGKMRPAYEVFKQLSLKLTKPVK